MSLYDKFYNMPSTKCKYYHNAPCMNFASFTTEDAYKFIRGTYTVGAKDKIFDVGFSSKHESEGKHLHTVSLYFMGCLHSDMIDKYLKSYLQGFIPNMNYWYDFKYTWYLTCLYHDTASVIEKEEWTRGCSSDLDFYLVKHDIKHNVFQHVWDNPSHTPYTYSEALVKSYFKYRVEHHHSIDHGIIAGYLLYDRLVKNYNSAWEKKTKASPNANFDDFYVDNLAWRKGHIPHFAIIADAIIAHNIWRSEKTCESKKVYRQYGLDMLVYSKCSRIAVKQSPLVFYLGLLDSIEPIKREFDGCDDLQKLRDINMDWDSDRIIITVANGNYTEWLNRLIRIAEWLAVTVKKISSTELRVKIR